MKKYKKIIFIALTGVLVIGATLGAVTMAQADDSADSSNTTSIWDRVAAIFTQNTGTEISSADLKTAFDQAREEFQPQMRENIKERVRTSLEDRLQQMLDEGKITQEQLDAYKAWIDAKPETMVSDEYKQWLESRPGMLSEEAQIWMDARPEGLNFGAGQREGFIKRGISRMGNMFHNSCAPEAAE